MAATATSGEPEPLEQALRGVVQTTQGVVVDDRAGDPAILGKHARLGLDDLRGEDAPYGTTGGQQRVAVEQREIAGELLHPVDDCPIRR